MKTLFALLLALPLVGIFGGCASSLVLDGPDRQHQIVRNTKLECGQFVEDWDYFWLVDKPSKLTPYVMPDRQ